MGGREGGKDRRKGVSEGGGDAYAEAYGYGGFGYMTPSPYAVPQEGTGTSCIVRCCRRQILPAFAK